MSLLASSFVIDVYNVFHVEYHCFPQLANDCSLAQNGGMNALLKG